MEKKKILIVEDETIVAKDTETMLKSLGYSVVGIAFTGKDGIKKAEETRPDLVMMDIVLGGNISGIQAAEEIKSHLNIPVIYVTAYADDNTLQKAKITEPYGYLLKPYEEKELVSAIEIAIYRYKLEMKLKESEEWLSKTLSSISDAVIATNEESTVIFMNPVAEKLTEWNHEVATGKPVKDVFTTINEETGKPFKVPVTTTIKEGNVVNLPTHTTLITKNGKKLPIYGSSAPIKDAKGKIGGAVLAFSDITERERAAKVQSALYNIINAVNTTKDLDELFKIIHRQLSTIIDTTNYYVALYDKETDTISLAYDVDQKDRFTSFPAGKTLTAYVIKTGKSLLVDEEVSEKLTQAGKVEMVGTPSKIWLGVPLKIENKVIGIVVVQSYTDASLYTEKDLAILEFVSDSIAIAIAHIRADNALENSEEKYRLLFGETPIGILTCDINGVIQSINNTALQLLGSPSEEATKQINLLTFPPLKEIGFSDELKHCMNEDREISSEKLYTSKWGKSVFFHYKIVPTLNQEGKITGVLCALEDITEQKRVEEIQSTIYKISDTINTTATLDEFYHTIHQLLGNVIDTTNFYIALYDEDKELIFFPYFVDEKDVKPEPIPKKLSKGLTEYVIRTGKPLFALKEYYMKLAEDGKIELSGSLPVVWIGVPLKTADKTIGVIAVQSYTDASIYTEKDVEILEFASDQIAIAIERRRTEEVRRKSEEKFRDLFENANDVIWTSDVKGRYLTVNHLFEKLLGYTKKELINKQSLHLISAEDREKSIENYQKAVSGKSTEYEATIFTKNGEKKIFWLKLRPLKENGKVIGIHGIGRDITSKKESEEALRKSEEQLRQAQKMEAIGRLAGGVAHDFNNLLTAINGRSDLILYKMVSDDPLRKEIEEIRKAGERAATLTRQLLAFGRKQTLQPKVLDINSIVVDMNRMLQHLIGERIELLTILEPKLGRIKADKGQIEQVIMNLTINARDSMPEGGKLTFETQNVILDEEYCKLHPGSRPGTYVMFAVSDTGHGMDKETQSHIFEPFFTTKKVGEGTGLGLSTVYGILKQSGGNIQAYSEPELGSTFKVYLPRVDEKFEFGKIPKYPAERLHGSETILIVEDEGAVRDIASDILKESGYTVLPASSGSEAISTCKQYKGHIHLMITDIVMPQMDGGEVAKQIKQILPKIKVLYMSGYTNNDVLNRGVLEQGAPFLQKPFTPEALVRKIRKVLENPQPKTE